MIAKSVVGKFISISFHLTELVGFFFSRNRGVFLHVAMQKRKTFYGAKYSILLLQWYTRKKIKVKLESLILPLPKTIHRHTRFCLIRNRDMAYSFHVYLMTMMILMLLLFVDRILWDSLKNKWLLHVAANIVIIILGIT